MMRKPRPEGCERRHLPARLKAEIMLRQEGCCADCGTRLILGFFVFDHRPPLALRGAEEDPNDPDRLAAICWTCNEQKTPRDLKEIARAKRPAEKHQEHLERQSSKVPGRRLPSTSQWQRLQGQVTGRPSSLPSSRPPLLGRPKGQGQGTGHPAPLPSSRPLLLGRPKGNDSGKG